MDNLWILDNGHGVDTPGKRSPKWSDGLQLLEWEFNRDIVDRIAYSLSRQNIETHILVPELEDISLTERCARANMLYKEFPKAILVSVHGNAGGGAGYEIWTSVGETLSDRIARIFYDIAKEEFPEMKFRIGTSDEDPSKEKDFTILVKTNCPAVLTENFFYDNETECRLMMDDAFRQRIANAHIKAIYKIEGIL